MHWLIRVKHTIYKNFVYRRYICCKLFYPGLTITQPINYLYLRTHTITCIYNGNNFNYVFQLVNKVVGPTPGLEPRSSNLPVQRDIYNSIHSQKTLIIQSSFCFLNIALSSFEINLQHNNEIQEIFKKKTFTTYSLKYKNYLCW